MSGVARGVPRELAAEEADFYLTHSVFSGPGDSSRLGQLPSDQRELAAAVRGLLIHRDEGDRFGCQMPEDRRNDAEARYVADILQILDSRRALALTVARGPADRFVGSGRDFALLLCAFLRQTGTPSRVRCGYAAYLTPGFHEDHWVTEYWDSGFGWRLADAQLASPEAMTAYKISFDPMRVPRDDFHVAGEAWQACRLGLGAPETFGVSGSAGSTGTRVVRASVVRDLAALNKVEVLPWDGWGLAEIVEEDLGDADRELLDVIAQVESRGGPYAELRRFYLEEPGLRAPLQRS
ncbi:transglutaminase-like domain-containing protein [Streptomyces spiramyceticus]|uniref:transglutaminase-like domain-containing protein n=1 Tax=Streptomyces spiramyceticus TaxID=299717 RepID=UPI00237BA5FA|nr:transglutaminase-like domain-containing protein [Streptomyces spiramyceticus]